MDSPKGHKTPRFASGNEVFNYTMEQSTNQDDSLLLTPNHSEAKENRQIRQSVRPQEKIEHTSNGKQLQDVEDFELEVKRKREEFMRRVSKKPAFFEESDLPGNHESRVVMK
jgi:hypothetical protein